jgi:acylphosphatase
MLAHAEIMVQGIVQGVGFRYFVKKCAQQLNLMGWTRNLPSGEVQTVVEGAREDIEQLYREIQKGPAGAKVEEYSIRWEEATGEFDSFEVRRQER